VLLSLLLLLLERKKEKIRSIIVFRFFVVSSTMAHAGSLSAAAATGDLVQIHTHMASGGFIDERDTHLNTPLHHACLAGNRAAVELLLSYGADVNAENMQGKSTLQFAGHSGDTVILRRLLEAGADANHQSHDGKTALLSSIVNDFPDAARILIEAGCDVDLPENEGNTPLHKAAQKDFPVCVQLLRSYGANQWVRNDAGKTPIDIARDANLPDVLDALLNPPLPLSHWSFFDSDDRRVSLALASPPPDVITQVPKSPTNNTATSNTTTSNTTATPAAAAAAAAAASVAANTYYIPTVAPIGASSPPAASSPVQQQHQSQFAPQARRAEAAASNEQSVLDKILAQPGVPHRTLYHFTGTRPDELTFMANQPILVLKRFDDGWCLGEHNDLIGMFPVKYAVIETRPRHSHTALVVSNNQSKPLLSENTTAPPNSGAPMTPIVVVPPPPAAAAPAAPTALSATQATSNTPFARSDPRVLAAHRLVSESEAALNVMLASIEKTRAREVQPFLDSLPTMAAATARAYDTSLRSVQLLAKLALAIDNASPASQVREANSLHENMLSVTTLWIQTRQALVDDGKNMRESVSMPLTTQLAEMSRTTASAHRAMAVYGRLMLDKVELLEKAASGSGKSGEVQAATDGLERAAKFVASRHAQIKESLHWRLGSTLAALLNGWRALAEIEFHLQTRSVKSSERMQVALDAIEVPDVPLPDSEWENEMD
jgi:ankyrin repeat protein